jgi:hypothetical protein
MMVRIECTSCGHVGVVRTSTLPRELRCWQCGSSRRVEAKGARRVASRTAIIEWLCGAEAPYGPTDRSGGGRYARRNGNPARPITVLRKW